jgi:hypothetical protein
MTTAARRDLLVLAAKVWIFIHDPAGRQDIGRIMSKPLSIIAVVAVRQKGVLPFVRASNINTRITLKLPLRDSKLASVHEPSQRWRYCRRAGNQTNLRKAHDWC